MLYVVLLYLYVYVFLCLFLSPSVSYTFKYILFPLFTTNCRDLPNLQRHLGNHSQIQHLYLNVKMLTITPSRIRYNFFFVQTFGGQI